MTTSGCSHCATSGSDDATMRHTLRLRANRAAHMAQLPRVTASSECPKLSRKTTPSASASLLSSVVELDTVPSAVVAAETTLSVALAPETALSPVLEIALSVLPAPKRAPCTAHVTAASSPSVATWETVTVFADDAPGVSVAASTAVVDDGDDAGAQEARWRSRARSARARSPVLSTWYGLIHDGTELSPQPPSHSLAASCTRVRAKREKVRK
jgi:hypothetical protein